MSFLDRFRKQPDTSTGTGAPTAGSTMEPIVPQSIATLETEAPEVHQEVEDDGAESTPAPPSGAQRHFASVPEERFSLEDTNLLAQIMDVPREERDARWVDAFQSAAWNASIVLPAEPVFVGPDGMPYVRLNLPPVGEPAETNCLSNLYVSMAEQGLGAAFFKSTAEGPEAADYVMPTGVLESLRAYGTWDGDPDDFTELAAKPQQHEAGSGVGKTDVDQERQVMVGSPSESYLPKHTAQLLYRHLTEGWKMEDPRIALVVDPQMTPTRNLVIGRKFSEFPDADIAGQAARMLLWYLPPRRYLLLMPENWTTDQMRPLRELC